MRNDRISEGMAMGTRNKRVFLLQGAEKREATVVQ
jgi:hypothetical protein